MLIISPIPAEFRKFQEAARVAHVPVRIAKTLIAAGTVPVAMDRCGYIWTSPDSLRNGATRDGRVQDFRA